MAKYDVSIIIVNYKTSHLLKPCIDSINELTNNITYEIIIIDNDSNDQGLKEIEKVYSTVNVIYHDENLGFGRANNKAVELAEGKYVLFLNPDTFLINNAIYELKKYLSSNTEVGAVGANLYDENMNPNISFEKYLPGKNLIIEVIKKIPKIPKPKVFNYTDKPLQVGYISGACFMIEKTFFQSIGRFDPEFFMYYEETELCARIQKVGKKIICLSSAKIVHLEGQSVKISDNKLKLMTKSKYIYFNKTLNNKKIITNYMLEKMYLQIICFFKKEPSKILFDKINLEKKNFKIERVRK